jgi:hypothetical protein
MKISVENIRDFLLYNDSQNKISKSDICFFVFCLRFDEMDFQGRNRGKSLLESVYGYFFQPSSEEQRRRQTDDAKK